MNLIYASDKNEMSRLAARFIAEEIRKKPDCLLGLATGGTPEGAYAELARLHREEGLDFSRVRTVNLDEYVGLPHSDPQSYYRYMHRNLFDLVNIPEENTFLPNGMASDLSAACREYDEILASMGRQDVQLLGIGQNGHIGFCEPGEALAATTSVITLSESTRKANARFFHSLSEVPTQALSLGIRQIMSARRILLIACGEEKSAILHSALNGPITTKNPASLIQLHPDVTVIDATGCVGSVA